MSVAPAGAATQTFDHSDRLASSSTVTVAGTRTTDGCEWETAPLELSASEVAKEARQISADWDTCSSVVEIGVPETASDDPDTADGTAEDVPAVEESPPEECRPWNCSPYGPASASASSGSGSGRYVVWWEDKIHIDVSKTRSHVTWSWNGVCTGSPRGFGSTWWRSGTGWSKLGASAYILPTCSVVRVRANATYKNDSVFCSNVVYNRYRDVTVRGYYDGRLSGFVAGTSATHCDNGPDLHWHARLIRSG